MARDWPKGTTELDRLALQRWMRLSQYERDHSDSGPPVHAYERLARRLGVVASCVDGRLGRALVDRKLEAWRAAESKKGKRR